MALNDFPTLALRTLPVFFTALLFQSSLSAADSSFPITELSDAAQTAMIENHCVICHLDNAMNGGVSFEHFSASTVSPSLAAVLVNKFTTGVPTVELLQSDLDPQTVEKIEIGKEYGAPSVMGVSGHPVPTEGEVNGFIIAMAQQSENSELWHVTSEGGVIVADIARASRLPESEYERLRDMIYRLVVTCDVSENKGEVLLTWSPIPGNGKMELTVDSETVHVFAIDEQEPMANGDPGTSPPSSVMLIGESNKDKYPILPVPEDSLRIQSPIYNGIVEFPFDELWELEPQIPASCFRP